MQSAVRTRRQSTEYGRAQRKHLSRAELGDFDVKHRQVDPLSIFRASCQGRIADLLALKFKLMADSVFAFYRGTVEIMAADLAAGKNTQIQAQLCGDAHVRNFGFFATPDGQCIFDINDFDETCRGPWEWDVKRMITSIVLGGREAGGNDAACREAVKAFLSEYCSWVHRFAEMSTLEVARHRVKRDLRRPALRVALAKAERSTPMQTLQKLAKKTSQGWRFRGVESMLWEVQGEGRKSVLNALPLYRETLAPDRRLIFDRFHPVDVAFKVVGTGSIGTRDYVVLMFGPDEKDPLFLQIKEEPPAIYSKYLQQPGRQNEGQRAVEGQRAMQIQSDLLLGWCSIDGRDYMVRQLNDHKASLDVQDLKSKHLLEYSRLCAELLAKGHARSGNPIAIASYLGSSGKAAGALLGFAMKYARQVEADYREFCDAWKFGAFQDLVGPAK